MENSILRYNFGKRGMIRLRVRLSHELNLKYFRLWSLVSRKLVSSFLRGSLRRDVKSLKIGTLYWSEAV